MSSNGIRIGEPLARAQIQVPVRAASLSVAGPASSATSRSRNVFSLSSFRTPRSTQVMRAFIAALRSTAPTPEIRSSRVHVP